MTATQCKELLAASVGTSRFTTKSELRFQQPMRQLFHYFAFDIDRDPLSSREAVMFARDFRAFALAAFADSGAALPEVHRAIVDRGNHSLPPAIRRAIFVVSNNTHQAVMERVRPIVHC